MLYEKKKSSDQKITPPVKATSSTPHTLHPHLKKIISRKKKKQYDLEENTSKLIQGDKFALSRAITIIESTQDADKILADKIIEKCLPFANKSIRLGITGSPGVGKSTFIEAFGSQLAEPQKKLAVLAVDPSSPVSKGSILGDKTRMQELAKKENVFIRPSPANTSLGGIARKTRETMVLCEAAGFDTIIVETVGVGQSETLVHSMVDFFLLLIAPGSGDELQGIKRGIVEMADLVIINKADGEQVKLANKTRLAYKNALHLFPLKESQWSPSVLTCSSLENKGLNQIRKQIEQYIRLTKKNKYFALNRKKQLKKWLLSSINQGLQDAFFKDDMIQKELSQIEKAVIQNQISPFKGAAHLLSLFGLTNK